jgi:hypothetical protein
MVKAQHSMESSEWYTPPPYIEAARECMGGIDFDPHSCAAANEYIGARSYGTIENPIELWPIGARVWDNPPNPPRPAWEHMVAHWRRGGMGIFLAYSIEQLQQSQGWLGTPMLDFSVCIPAKRISFLCRAQDALAMHQRRMSRLKDEMLAEEDRAKCEKLKGRIERLRGVIDGLPDEGLIPGEQPAHASALVGVGVCPVRFAEHFRPFGRVLRGCL